MNELDFWLDQILTEELKKTIALAVFKGFMEVENLYNRESFLATPTAKDPKPYNRKVAIDYFLSQLEKTNRLFKSNFVPNAAQNCLHIEVHIKNPFKNLLITHNGINDPREHPRKAIFRDFLEDNAQYSFKYDAVTKILSLPTREDLIQLPSYNNYIYGQLCYGGDVLPEFIFLGISDGSNYDWIRRIELPTNVLINTSTNDIQTENEPTLRPEKKIQSDDDDDDCN